MLVGGTYQLSFTHGYLAELFEGSPMLISLVPLGLVKFSKEDFSVFCMDGKGLCARTLRAEYEKSLLIFRKHAFN